MSKKTNNIQKNKSLLSREQYNICWEKGTEPAFSGKLLYETREGFYCCVCCNTALFNSNTKYDSGSGWPSFWGSLPFRVYYKKDLSHGVERLEILCATCDSHLGHMFDDGPQPTGLRFCVNSLSMSFVDKVETAIFGAGCFWGVENTFYSAEGVLDTTVGYSGGNTTDPTYEDICTKNTGHAETVMIRFSQDKTSFSNLLDIFWQCHDPTTLNRQGQDIGSQYRSVIFYCDEEQKNEAIISRTNIQTSFENNIVTEITSFNNFYPAEEYHQKYILKGKI